MKRLVGTVLSLAVLAVATACSRPAAMSMALSCVDVRPVPVPARSVRLPHSLAAGYELASNADLKRTHDAVVSSYMDLNDVSREEAELWLTVQLEAEDLNAWLLERYPNELGQVRLEHTAPGTLVVPTTDPASLLGDVELARYPHLSSVVVERVVWSKRTVVAIVRCLHDRYYGIRRNEAQFAVDLDPVAGRIWIEAADTDVGRAFLASAAVAGEVLASRGVIETRTQPWHPPGVQKGG